MNDVRHQHRLGSCLAKDGSCEFLVWAPHAAHVEVELLGADRTPRLVSLDAKPCGYHGTTVTGVVPGTRYWYRLDGGKRRADPASRWQPEGHGGPSAVLDDAFAWTDEQWRGRPLGDYVIYELHVGTFTRDGTFDAAIERLPELAAVGITVIELMPVATFPGDRNWGYDGVFPFAVHQTYGGPHGLRRFVDACHHHGIAVALDVVYNHLGPEGGILEHFGPYFTNVYVTPWGQAFNFDGPDSDEVRRYCIENAMMWLRDYRLDALRLDAVHAILDRSPRPFLSELADRVRQLSQADGRERLLIAESEANDPRLVTPRDRGGLGLDAVWADDFHHAVHVALTGEDAGYYADYTDPQRLLAALSRGFAYTGDYSNYRRRRHGAESHHAIEPERFVVCVQNHDQVGNRPNGDRLGALVDLPAQRLAAGLLLSSPFTPLLFMGEEYGELQPFAYFVSHGTRPLIESVRNGRKREFAEFGWQWNDEPLDPQAPETFESSRMDPSISHRSPHREIAALYRALLELRRGPLFQRLRAQGHYELAEAHLLKFTLGTLDEAGPAILGLFNLGRTAHRVEQSLPGPGWRVLLDGSAPEFGGDGPTAVQPTASGRSAIALAPHAFVLLARDGT